MEEQSRKRFSFDSLAMYGLAVTAETPVIVVRLMLLFCIALLLSALKGHPMALYGPWWEIALLPTLWSAVALVTPIGTGWWWKQRIGGRAASQREQFAYEDGVELLQANAQHPLPLPSSWFVLDTPQPDAAVCGNTLMLSRGLLETDHLPAVLAHELGHLATPDGRLTAAINRLFLWMPKERRAHGQQGSDVDDDEFLLKMILLAIRIALATIRGGFGLRITRPIWGMYWRKREYKADLYAASLGQADELADFLEIHALIHDHPVPFIWLTEHTHPPTELRIGRLRSAAVAPGSEPVKPAPSEPPAAGPDGPALTEPKPSAGRALMWAGRALPRSRGHR